MRKQENNIIKTLLFAVIMVLLTLTMMSQSAYAQEKEVRKSRKDQIWITYGEESRLSGKYVREYFGVKDKNVKVTFSAYDNKRLKVSKNGLVKVRKPDKTCRNAIVTHVLASFKYKGVNYYLTYNFVVCYEYDDNNPNNSSDVTPDMIKRFKQAYRTGNTKKLSAQEKKVFKRLKLAVNYSKSGKNGY